MYNTSPCPQEAGDLSGNKLLVHGVLYNDNVALNMRGVASGY